MNEDEVAANFSFLAMDETTAKDSGLVRKHRSKAEGTMDTHNKVFVWGLNDRGQLGSEIGDSKVRIAINSSYDIIYIGIDARICFPLKRPPPYYIYIRLQPHIMYLHTHTCISADVRYLDTM